ncbi:MAG: hypothetical protein U0T74_13555 [Chitinophagales bacterium]
MKTIYSFLLLCSFAFTTFLQAQNPFAEYGIKTDVLTFSNGKFDEFVFEDSIVQIGTVLFNSNTGKIISFIQQDTAYSEATLKPEITSRWLSPDPLAAKYPYFTPYQFADNSPIYYIDPDGRDVIPSPAFNKSAYAPVFEKMQANSVYKQLVSRFEAPATKTSFNYRINFQEVPVDINTNKYATSRYGQTSHNPTLDETRNGRGDLTGLDVGTAMFQYPMSKDDGEGGCQNLNEIGKAAAFLHEVVHASLSSFDIDEGHKSFVENGGREDIQNGLLEYAKGNNISLTNEQAELVSWYGLQGTPQYAEKFGFEGKTDKERAAIVSDNNKKIDAIIFTKEKK